jgi:hypothetical protein
MKLKFDKVAKGHGPTQYNQLHYSLEKQRIEFKTSAKIKRNGGDDYFITVKNLRFKFNCVGELVEIVITEKGDNR